MYCEVRINGGSAGPLATTLAGPSGQTSFTGGQVTYTASDTDTVTLCAVWTGDASGESCSGVSTQEIPPDAVFQLLEDVFQLLADLTAPTDPIICGVIRDTLGLPGIVNPLASTTGLWIDPDDCDIWLVRDVLPAPLPTIFPCPTRVIDFIAPYGDPARSDMPSC